MFSVKQSDGIAISFGKTLVASLWEGVWIREQAGRHADWAPALEAQPKSECSCSLCCASMEKSV